MSVHPAMTKNEILGLLIVANSKDYPELCRNVIKAYDELVNSEVYFPCVAYWKKGSEVWASNRVEKGAERISLEVYTALRPGYLSDKYPSPNHPPHQNTLEL